jgi:hypothetical protein
VLIAAERSEAAISAGCGRRRAKPTMCGAFCCDIRPKSKAERNSIVAWRTESNELQAIWEQVMSALTAHGLDDLKRPLELLLNEAVKAERGVHLNGVPARNSDHVRRGRRRH